MRLNMQTAVLCLLLGPLGLIGALPAHGQDDKKAAREREVLKRAQQALRQAEEQRAALQSEKTALEDKLKATTTKAEKLTAAEKELAIAQRRAAASGADLAKSRQTNTELEKKLADAGAKYAQLSQLHTEAIRTIASRDAQIKLGQASLTQVRGETAACEAKNARLYTYGNELMQRYRDKTAFEAIRQAEPLTGLKQAQIDNVLEEYRGKLEAQKILQ
jgi:DNA repair exonuclease SbcCD ATPase subunit